MLILDFHHSVATVHRWYFKQVVLVELQARCIEVSIEWQRRDFYRRYFAGLVLPELLESPIYARLRRESTIEGLPEHAVWDYYLENILPTVSRTENYDQLVEDSEEVQSPPSVDWNFVDLDFDVTVTVPAITTGSSSPSGCSAPAVRLQGVSRILTF